MSWSAALPKPVAVGEARAVLFELTPSPAELCDEARDQFDAARKAAADLVESGAVGSRPVRISLSGHGNTNHEPDPSWANDCVAISIQQA